MNEANHCTCRNCTRKPVCKPYYEILSTVIAAKHFNTSTKVERPTVGVLNTVFYKLAECCTKFELTTQK